MEILDGIKVSKKIEEELKNKIKATLSIALIQINNDPNSGAYTKSITKKCKEFNIDVITRKFNNEKEEAIIKYIENLNSNKKINGIIISKPISSKYNEHRIINAISREKDIDGQTDINTIKLMNYEACFVPCTVLGIENILKYYKIDLKEKNITIINRSNTIGKPLLFRLLQNDCTVTICHSKTKNLKDICKNSDIIITAIGKKQYLDKNYISKNQVIIDAGITVEDGKIYGDVKYDEVAQYSSYITKVPGGVGPMTITAVIENLYKAYKKQNNS